MLSIKPLSDQNALASLYANSYISRIGHDHRPAAPISHPDVHYLGAYVGADLVGAFLVIESGFIEVDLHALLTKRALKHSRALGRMCIDYVFERPEIVRVTAYVIDSLTAARNYCRKLGFKDEGYRRDACQQEGILRGIYIMGLTRKDWKEQQA